MEFTRDQILEAIKKIDHHPALKNGRNSSTYDLVFEGKKYPPILVLSEANKLKGEKELYLADFDDKTDIPFKILSENGFEIIKKVSASLSDKFKKFSSIYKAEWNKQHSKSLESYKILVNDVPKLIREKFPLNQHITIKGSIGAGVNTAYPWLGIFDRRVSTGATNGFYIVLLFSDDFEYLYLTLNQGATVQAKEVIETNRNFVLGVKNELKGFISGKLPMNSLVRTIHSNANKNGEKYEKTNIYYREYKISELRDEDLITHLNVLLNFYDKCVMKFTNEEPNPLSFKIDDFKSDLKKANFQFSYNLILRFIASIATKPFVILTGLSGSGKTKLAQSFVQWICGDQNQYRIIPVGADWTNREPLLGYPNALKPEEYVKPDSGVLDLIIEASRNPDLPYFLILDEMNLSNVERYFADFLSVMESKEEIPLYAEGTVDNGVPSKLKVSSNLSFIGTVNIDETTNMFSPKVLDRANTIEFRVTQEEMKNFLGNIKDINIDALSGKGAGMAGSFLKMAANREFATEDIAEINAALVQFFGELKKTGAEFGYRSATEIMRLINQLTVLDGALKTSDKIDIAIMQKLLPKLHGSRRKLCPVLETLGSFCVSGELKIIKDVFDNADFDFKDEKVLFPLSLEKITRMYRGAIDNGFASFAEA
ncbi:MrcB family domain-containing protein [Kaistella sp.]|uniref:MrcB family domain-containing protein n=1 Tax=Kaistella sp. TaxID=2782235 RepID=UPI002F948284